MYREQIGRMRNPFPAGRYIYATNTWRSSSFLPMALHLASIESVQGSGSIRGPFRKTCSISGRATPCLATCSRFPSSQPNSIRFNALVRRKFISPRWMQPGSVGKLESASQSRERIRNFKKVSVVYPLNSDVFEISSTCQTCRCRVFRQPQPDFQTFGIRCNVMGAQ